MAQIPTVRLLILSLLAACGGGGSDEPGNPSQFSLSLSDAPVDNAQKVCIAIAGLRLNDDSGTEQASWSVLDLLPTDHQEVVCPAAIRCPQRATAHRVSSIWICCIISRATASRC